MNDFKKEAKTLWLDLADCSNCHLEHRDCLEKGHIQKALREAYEKGLEDAANIANRQMDQHQGIGAIKNNLAEGIEP